MSSEPKNVDYIMEQMSGAGEIRSLKMFGEYGIYCRDKIIALVCEDQLYIKPTEAGRQLLKDAELAPPYPGAKPYLLVPAEQWDNRELLSLAADITASELPEPKGKK